MTGGGPGPASRALAARLAAAESRNVTALGDDFPVFWDRAAGCTVTDADGRAYLDTTGAFGVAALGHGHPDVVEAVRVQAEQLLHGMGDVHPPSVKVALCERLCETAPWPDARVILSGGGAEAVEAALKTAAITTGRPGVLAVEGAYHGLSYGALAVTHRDDFRAPWRTQLPGFASFIPFPATEADTATALARVDAKLAEGTAAGRVGAVIFEPIQGRAGVRVAPPGFWAGVAERARAHGAMVIADEIFTGLGRTGTFWACESEDVVPDLLVCGKALGGGMPIGACIGSAEAMAGWPASDGEALHTSTFLGHPVCCAAACAALDLLRAPAMLETVRERGALLQAGLQDLAARHACAREVRGRGLMLGLALDSAERCGTAMTAGLAHGLILLGGGTDRDVLTFTPPYVITTDEIAELVRRLDATLDACRT